MLWKDVGNSGSRGSCRTATERDTRRRRRPDEERREKENLDCERSVLERAPAIRSTVPAITHSLRLRRRTGVLYGNNLRPLGRRQPFSMMDT